jgi:hypothetical protein
MIRVCVRLAGLATVAGLVLAAPQALSAQDATVNHLYDKFQATLDFSTVLNNSEARVDGSAGEGTTLNFKDLLGIAGSSVQPALGLAWKPGRHTELSVGYQFINQSGTRSFSDSLVIGDNTVFGDIDADTKVSSDNANLAFKYSILAKEKYNVGVELGLGAIFFDLQLDATATGCAGPDCASGSVSIDKKLTVPTGALGVFGQWRLGDHWYVGADARGIGGKVDRYDVSIFQADVFARYFFSDRWGAGAGWYYNDVTVDVAAKSGSSSDSDLDLGGKVSFNYTSLRLGVIAAF